MSKPASSRPVIGIPSRYGEEGDQWFPAIQGARQSYIDSVIAAGGLPVMLALSHDEKLQRAAYEICDGILLAGGDDVDPKFYGEEPHPKLGSVCVVRDETEIAVTKWCVEEKKPLFGICRGVQLLNVALGGSLYQDLPSQCESTGKHGSSERKSCWEETPHVVAIEADSRLAALLGTREMPVNSLHHQALKVVAPGLRVTAQAPDGVIEGVESRDADHFLLGVQGHPETLWQNSDSRWLSLFGGLVEAAGHFRSSSRARC